MAESIYRRNEQGEILPVTEPGQSASLTEEPFASERTLQELVAEHPKLLSGEQMTPDDPRRWILIKQEQGISDTAGGSIRWSLDILLVDQDAVPTLAEVKLSSNSEIHRKIVGQIFQYAAHAPTLKMRDIRRDFEESRSRPRQDPKDALAALLRSKGEPDVEEFWRRVEKNLEEARLCLLFVSDGIPDELARVAEFLNEQMPSVQVLPVEIKQFTGPAGRMWKTRVIDRAPAPAPDSPCGPAQQKRINYDEFLSQMPSPEVEAAARRLLYVAWDHNADVSWDVKCVKVGARSPSLGKGKSQTVAWLYTPSATRGMMGCTGFVFGFGSGYMNTFKNMPGNVLEVLDDWSEQFSNDSYATESPLSTGPTDHKSWAFTHEDAAGNIDVLAERLDNVLLCLRQLEPMQE